MELQSFVLIVVLLVGVVVLAEAQPPSRVEASGRELLSKEPLDSSNAEAVYWF